MIFIVDGARAVSSFVMRSAMPDMAGAEVGVGQKTGPCVDVGECIRVCVCLPHAMTMS